MSETSKQSLKAAKLPAFAVLQICETSDSPTIPSAVKPWQIFRSQSPERDSENQGEVSTALQAVSVPSSPEEQAAAIMKELANLNIADLADEGGFLDRRYARLIGPYTHGLALETNADLRDAFYRDPGWLRHQGHKPVPGRDGPELAMRFAVMRVAGGHSRDRNQQASMLGRGCWFLARQGVPPDRLVDELKASREGKSGLKNLAKLAAALRAQHRKDLWACGGAASLNDRTEAGSAAEVRTGDEPAPNQDRASLTEAGVPHDGHHCAALPEAVTSSSLPSSGPVPAISTAEVTGECQSLLRYDRVEAEFRASSNLGDRIRGMTIYLIEGENNDVVVSLSPDKHAALSFR